jgi:hypothetical protein
MLKRRPAVEALHKSKTRIPLLARFALVAQELSPTTAINDIETFERMNESEE